MTESRSEPIDAERADPEHANSELVAQPATTPDAERFNDGLSRGGPLIPDEAPNESDLPGPAQTKVTPHGNIAPARRISRGKADNDAAGVVSGSGQTEGGQPATPAEPTQESTLSDDELDDTVLGVGPYDDSRGAATTTSALRRRRS